MKLVCFIVITFFILHTHSNAQQKLFKEGWTSVRFTNRIQRLIKLTADSNKPLTNLYNPTDSNQHIATVLFNALLNENIKAYFNVDDPDSYLSKAQIQQILTDTKDATGVSYNPMVINEIMIYEDWFPNKQMTEVKRQILALAPVVRNTRDTAKFYALFYIKPSDVFFVCKDHHMYIPGNGAMTIQEYIEERHFTSRLIKLKRIKEEYV